MEINLIKTKEITEFEKEIGIELYIHERSPYRDRLFRYYVNFKDSDTKQGGILGSTYGNGNTIDEAIKEYCEKISNKILIFNPYSKDRKEIEVPILVHTKLLNK